MNKTTLIRVILHRVVLIHNALQLEVNHRVHVFLVSLDPLLIVGQNAQPMITAPTVKHVSINVVLIPVQEHVAIVPNALWLGIRQIVNVRLVQRAILLSVVGWFNKVSATKR